MQGGDICNLENVYIQPFQLNIKYLNQKVYIYIFTERNMMSHYVNISLYKKDNTETGKLLGLQQTLRQNQDKA